MDKENETIVEHWLTKSSDVTEIWEEDVRNLFKCYREGELLRMADSHIAHTHLVESYYIEGEPRTPSLRAQAMQLLLRWAVDKLRPSGAHSWTANLWRHYNILNSFYLQGERVSILSELMGISDQTLYEWRSAALLAVTTVLQDELRRPADEAARRKVGIVSRYHSHDQETQRLMRLLSIFDFSEFVSVDWLWQLLQIQTSTTALLRPLIDAYFVQWGENGRVVRLHPDLQPILKNFVSRQEFVSWHEQVGTLYLADHAYLKAIHHWIQAGRWVQSAELIVAHQQTLFDQNQAEALHTLVHQFSATSLTRHPNLWAELKLVEAKSAEYLQDLPSALAASGAALTAPDFLIKAHAYYRRAKLFQQLNLDESLTHYGMCIDLLERLQGTKHVNNTDLCNLQIRVYIDRAWISIQERPNFPQAEADLSKAEQLIPPDDNVLWCDLYNARAGLIGRIDSDRATLPYRLKAWVAACETGDVQRMMRNGYNLGYGYLWDAQYDLALSYFKKSLALAQDASNQQYVAISHKGIGNVYYFQGLLDSSIEHYLIAYQCWKETNNDNWLAHICHDLAEVEASLQAWESARLYYKEGSELVARLGLVGIGASFEALIGRYPLLKSELNERQTKVIAFLMEHGSISRQQYVELFALSPTQAYRDLEEMCAQQLIKRVGKGRSTTYQLF